MTRTEQTMLRAAMDFCSADADVLRRTALMGELRRGHPETNVCYLAVKNEFGEIIKRPLPASKWCEHCKRLPPEVVDYSDAKWQRRAAKTRMKRAYKKLAVIES